MINQKIRQASPECTHPIRSSESQTSYPRVHTTRQAIPGFNGETPWIKRGAADPQRERERERDSRREEKSSQEIVGNTGLQSRNILGYTHAAGR